MFRIHKVFDVTTPTNRQLLSQVQAMLRVQFNALSEKDIAKLPAQLANPLKYRFRSILLVAEDGDNTVRGFAMLLHAPDLEFCYLDYICAGRGETGGGVGGALYARVREEAFQLGVIGIFLECLPDDPALSPDTSIAAHHLSLQGKVALLDIDYHHGNGAQNIFYRRKDVYTVSLHGHPRYSYPYFSGFDDEKGEGEGKGYNLNYPLVEGLKGEQYRKTLTQALDRIRKFKPQFLVLALGLDTAKGDPTGSFQLLARDFHENGRMIGNMRLPTLVVQEGGYKTQTLGINARHFFTGLWAGIHNTSPHTPGQGRIS